MVEGLSHSSRVILWAVMLAIVALAWGAMLGLHYGIVQATRPTILWLDETVGPWGSYAVLVAAAGACFYFGWRLERQRHREQYARDKTIHVERPNWWRQPLGRTRIPRVVWFYVGIFALVAVLGVVASAPQ